MTQVQMLTKMKTMDILTIERWVDLNTLSFLLLSIGFNFGGMLQQHRVNIGIARVYSFYTGLLSTDFMDNRLAFVLSMTTDKLKRHLSNRLYCLLARSTYLRLLAVLSFLQSLQSEIIQMIFPARVPLQIKKQVHSLR